MKECSKCKEVKPAGDFYNSRYKYDENGLDYYCKYCRVGTAIKSHRGGNKKPCSVENCDNNHYAYTYCRMHYARYKRYGTTERKNKPIAKDNTYYFKGKPYIKKAYVLKHKYNMEMAEFEERSAKGCELCGDKPTHSLHVDHDHKCCDGPVTCGKCVRGIVCNRCNKAIDKYETGLMRPDYPNLEQVAEYVRKYNG